MYIWRVKKMALSNLDNRIHDGSLAHQRSSVRAVRVLVAIVGISAIAAFVSLRPSSLLAQFAGQGEVELAGTFEGAQGEMIRLKDPQGNFVVAALIPRRSTVTYSGKADRAILKRGTFVRFTSHAGPDGNFLSPVGSVELYVPNPELLERRASPLDMSYTHPGVYVMAMILPQQPGELPNPDVRVVGRIMAIEETVMGLQCGERTLKLEIEANLHVTIESPTLEFARSGDAITGKGVFNSETRQLMIQSLRVTGAKTLGTEQAANAPGPQTKMLEKKMPEKKMTAKEKAQAKKDAALAKKNKKANKDQPEIKETLPAETTPAPSP